jgi:hypothetical protein
MVRRSLAALLLILAASPLTAPFQTWHLPGSGASAPQAVSSTARLSTSANVAEPAVLYSGIRRQLGCEPSIGLTPIAGATGPWFSTDSLPGTVSLVAGLPCADPAAPLITGLRI